MQVQTTINIDMYTLASTLCSAMEGGIGYWSRIEEYKKPIGELTITLDKLSNEHFNKLYPNRKQDEETIYRHIDYPLNDGGGVVLRETEADSNPNRQPLHCLTFEKLMLGVRTMAEKYPQHFADMLKEGASDATTGDVLVQCAIFGEIKYG